MPVMATRPGTLHEPPPHPPIVPSRSGRALIGLEGIVMGRLRLGRSAMFVVRLRLRGVRRQPVEVAADDPARVGADEFRVPTWTTTRAPDGSRSRTASVWRSLRAIASAVAVVGRDVQLGHQSQRHTNHQPGTSTAGRSAKQTAMDGSPSVSPASISPSPSGWDSDAAVSPFLACTSTTTAMSPARRSGRSGLASRSSSGPHGYATTNNKRQPGTGGSPAILNDAGPQASTSSRTNSPSWMTSPGRSTQDGANGVSGSIGSHRPIRAPPRPRSQTADRERAQAVRSDLS
jgi:hypothetical protein